MTNQSEQMDWEERNPLRRSPVPGTRILAAMQATRYLSRPEGRIGFDVQGNGPL